MTASPLHAAGLSRPDRKHEDYSCRGVGDRRRDGPAASEHRERDYFRAICAGEGFSVRATGIVGTLKTEIWKTPVRLPAPYSNRAAALDRRSVIRRDFLPATVFAGALSVVGSASAPLRHFLLKLVWPFKAARRLLHSLPRSIALQACKQSARCCSKAFHFHSLSAGRSGLVSTGDGHTSTERKSACPTKEFPKLETEFPGLK